MTRSTTGDLAGPNTRSRREARIFRQRFTTHRPPRGLQVSFGPRLNARQKNARHLLGQRIEIVSCTSCVVRRRIVYRVASPPGEQHPASSRMPGRIDDAAFPSLKLMSSEQRERCRPVFVPQEVISTH